MPGRVVRKSQASTNHLWQVEQLFCTRTLPSKTYQGDFTKLVISMMERIKRYRGYSDLISGRMKILNMTAYLAAPDQASFDRAEQEVQSAFRASFRCRQSPLVVVGVSYLPGGASIQLVTLVGCDTD